MSKVYVVTDGEYSDYHICAIFSTLPKAQAYREEFDYGDIEPIEVDDPEVGQGFFRVEMARSGAVVHIDHEEGKEKACFYFSKLLPSEGSFTSLRCVVETDDKERAIKVVNEKRVQLIALGLWGKNLDAKTYAELEDLNIP